MVNETSARPRAAFWLVPAKMTSSIFVDRTALGAWAPRTQAKASTTLDLPLPLGPTTTVTPGSRSIEVVSAKDLKPFNVRFFRNTGMNLASANYTRVARTLWTNAIGADRIVVSDLSVTEVRPTTAEFHALDGQPRPRAELTGASPDLEMVDELTGITADVDEWPLGHRGASVLQGVVHGPDDRRAEDDGFPDSRGCR